MRHETGEICTEIAEEQKKRRQADDRQPHHPSPRLQREQDAAPGGEIIHAGIIPAGLHDAHVVQRHVQPDVTGKSSQHPVVPVQAIVLISGAGREQQVGQCEGIGQVDGSLQLGREQPEGRRVHLENRPRNADDIDDPKRRAGQLAGAGLLVDLLQDLFDLFLRNGLDPFHLGGEDTGLARIYFFFTHGMHLPLRRSNIRMLRTRMVKGCPGSARSASRISRSPTQQRVIGHPAHADGDFRNGAVNGPLQPAVLGKSQRSILRRGFRHAGAEGVKARSDNDQMVALDPQRVVNRACGSRSGQTRAQTPRPTRPGDRKRCVRCTSTISSAERTAAARAAATAPTLPNCDHRRARFAPFAHPLRPGLKRQGPQVEMIRDLVTWPAALSQHKQGVPRERRHGSAYFMRPFSL